MHSRPSRYRGPAHAYARRFLVKLPLSAVVGKAPLWATRIGLSPTRDTDASARAIRKPARASGATRGGRALSHSVAPPR
jgi:hypothetical protein